MPRIIFLKPRALQCPAGYPEYHCQKNGFNGCCAIDPCDLTAGCPVEKDGTPSSSNGVTATTSNRLSASSTVKGNPSPLSQTIVFSSSSLVSATIAASAPVSRTSSTQSQSPGNSESPALFSVLTTTITPTPTDSASTTGGGVTSGHHSNGALIGGIVGGVAGSIIVLLVGLLVWTQYKHRHRSPRQSPKVTTEDTFDDKRGPAEISGSPLNEMEATEATSRPGTGIWFGSSPKAGATAVKVAESLDSSSKSPVSPDSNPPTTPYSQGAVSPPQAYQPYQPYRPTPRLPSAELQGSPATAAVSAISNDSSPIPHHTSPVAELSSSSNNSPRLNDASGLGITPATPIRARNDHSRPHCMSWVYYDGNGNGNGATRDEQSPLEGTGKLSGRLTGPHGSPALGSGVWAGMGRAPRDESLSKSCEDGVSAQVIEGER